MGGLYGHISHIHEDLSLTFGDIKQIYKLCANNFLEDCHEKTDGQNVLFTYEFEKNRIIFARNKTNIKDKQYLTDIEIKQKWNDLPKVQQVYLEAYQVLNSFINSVIIGNSLQQMFYNSNTKNNIWYSAEILSKINPNVINYNRNLIVLHQSCFMFDDSGNKVLDINDNSLKNAYKLLINNIPDKLFDNEYRIIGPQIIATFIPENKLNIYIINLDSFMNFNNLKNDNTIEDYLLKIYPDFHNLKTKKQKEKISNDVLTPVKNIIYDFSCKFLQDIQSNLCLNHEKALFELRYKLVAEINKLQNHDNKLCSVLLNQFLKDLEVYETTSVEGITFRYKNKIYKLTGYFPKINSIMGILRY